MNPDNRRHTERWPSDARVEILSPIQQGAVALDVSAAGVHNNGLIVKSNMMLKQSFQKVCFIFDDDYQSESGLSFHGQLSLGIFTMVVIPGTLHMGQFAGQRS